MTTAELRELLAKAIDLAEEYCGGTYGEAHDALDTLIAAVDERDALSAEVAGLRARIEGAPVVTVVENHGYTYMHKHYAPASADMLGKRVALVELPAPPVAGGGEG
jgi:hypothetical protein